MNYAGKITITAGCVVVLFFVFNFINDRNNRPAEQRLVQSATKALVETAQNNRLVDGNEGRDITPLIAKFGGVPADFTVKGNEIFQEKIKDGGLLSLDIMRVRIATVKVFVRGGDVYVRYVGKPAWACAGAKHALCDGMPD